MKRYNITGYGIALFLLMFLSSCNEFLETPPSKRNGVEITTVEHLDAVFSNFSSFYAELCLHPYGSDDYDFPASLYLLAPTKFPMVAIQFGLWNTVDLPNLSNTVWSAEYSKIFSANMVLDFIDKVSGDAVMKDDLRAEAHFIRAYSMWTLANMHCLPYSETNKNEMGLSIKSSTSFEQPLDRATLKETYDMIERDIMEALKLNVSLTASGSQRAWRASREAIQAFAARFYLHMGNYQESLKYTKLALSGYDELVDYNSEITYKPEYTNVGTQRITVNMPSTSSIMMPTKVVTAWKEFYYCRILLSNNWLVPSSSLMQTYDQDHDLRFKYHFVKNYSVKFVKTNPLENIYPGYVFFSATLGLPFGLTTSEMILTKAECEARLSDKWQEAMETLKPLRKKRMDAKAPGFVNLTAASQADAIKKVLEERRRELAFTHRWYDMRRLNNNNDANDDVEEVSKVFYPYNSLVVLKDEPVVTYKLPKNSRRYAIPLPFTDIDASQGVLKQNTY